MQFLHIIPALFAASTLATTFTGFQDISCQDAAGSLQFVSAADQERIVADTFATTEWDYEASRAFSPPGSCPSNKDDTFKWVNIPKWHTSSQGGAIAVVYFNETDTYHVCAYLASVQRNGYKGSCG